LRLSSGHLLLIYNNDARSRSRLTAALSADDGRHWPIRRVVAQGPGVAYPALSQTPDGRIHLLYSKSKRSIQHVEFNEAWIAAG
jgi:predicted neuraminidase